MGITVGTFLIGTALLAFEILSSRTLGFVLGAGYVYLTVALAMLGMSAAGSVLSVLTWQPTDSRRALLLFESCLALAVLLVTSYHATAWFKDVINARILAEGLSSGASGAAREIASSRLWIASLLGVILSIPYFLFGFVLTLLFRTLDATQYHRIYCADLAGGALGCVVVYGLMEHSSYAASVMFPPLCLIGAALAYVHQYRTKWTWGCAAAVLLLICAHGAGGLGASIEPRGELHQLAKDYGYQGQVAELWHGWNSFSRISAVETTGPKGAVDSWMTFGNGEGHAALLRPKPPGLGSRFYVPSRLALALGAPQAALVLFAGAGADMMALDEDLDGKTDITGVELNRTMVDGAKSLSTFALERFYGKDNIHFILDDARTFLERDKTQYQVVLLSWAGASPAYFDGSISSTTQYVFTREAMERIFDRLDVNGFAIYLSTNKLTLLAAARAIMEERGLPEPRRAIVVLTPRGSAGVEWTQSWDNNSLLIKPSGFSRAEVEKIRAIAEPLAQEIVYSPYEPLEKPDARIYDDVLTRPVMADALDELGAAFEPQVRDYN